MNKPLDPIAATPLAAPALAQGRLVSLDAYRGLIMMLLAVEGFELHRTAKNFPDSRMWQTLGEQFEHSEWTGCTFWDLILPSFMFMVGVSMPYSYARRRAMGHSNRRMLGHAIGRSVVLIALGVFLFTMTIPSISGVMNVLAQIGLGYTLVFLLWDRPAWLQIAAATAALAGTWAMFYFYPTAGIDPQTGSPQLLWWTDMPAAWAQEHLAGLAPQWHANANIAAAIDLWLYAHVLPHDPSFRPGLGGYQIIGFLPEIALMTFGVMAGELLRSDRTKTRKLCLLIAAGIAGLIAGELLDRTGLCPMVKKIFTPSFALFSAGWCFLFLAGLYAVTDVAGLRRWSWPFVIVGMNSIVMYVMYILMRPFTAETYRRFLGRDLFDALGAAYAPTVEAAAVGLVLWLICYWLYRRRVFIRI